MKFLIIGAGMIGRVHADALKKLNYSFDVCDANRDFADRLAADCGGEQVFYDYKEAIRKTDAAAVIICTPNHLHCDPAVFAMQNGLDVLCEKPIASNVEQARLMYETQRTTGRFLMVGYIVRCYQALDETKRILDSGVLGKLVSARCILATPETLDVAKTNYRVSYETGGGIIYDYTHEIDYCRYLFGEASYAACMCGSYLNQERSVDDSADILMHFVSGLNLELHMDYIQWTGYGGKGRSFDIVCEKGVLHCDFKTVVVDYYDGHSEKKTFSTDWAECFPVQTSRFVRALNGEPGVPYVSAESGLKTLEIADKLYLSSRNKVFVEL